MAPPDATRPDTPHASDLAGRLAPTPAATALLARLLLKIQEREHAAARPAPAPAGKGVGR